MRDTILERWTTRKDITVARSDLLRALLGSWAQSDDAGFLVAAEAVIAEERRKGHMLMARNLEESLRDPRRPGAKGPLTLRPVPKGRDDRPLLALSKPKRDFRDLVLNEPALKSLYQIVHENLNRSLLATHSLRPRQRLLIVGPSGTGKTASAHAIASELSLPVATANLAALTSSYLGETARNIEAVLQFADSTPCVLLLDEFDALANERSAPGDHGELRRVVATVLQSLEEPRGESLVVATSNHPHMLDSAVWRRFDEVVRLIGPDPSSMGKLIQLKLSGVDSKIALQRWVQRLANYSAAEVELACVDARRQAVLNGTGRITDDDMESAVQRLATRATAVSTANFN